MGIKRFHTESDIAVSDPAGPLVWFVDHEREISLYERLLQSDRDAIELLVNERDMLREELSEARKVHDIDVRIVKEHRDALESYHDKHVKLEQQLADACKPSVSDVIFPQSVLDDIMMASNTMLARRIEELEKQLALERKINTAGHQAVLACCDENVRLNKYIESQEKLFEAVLFTGVTLAKELSHIKSVMQKIFLY